MRLFKYIFALTCLFFQINIASAVCDFTTSDPVIITPSGTHNSGVGYIQLYVLTDFNGLSLVKTVCQHINNRYYNIYLILIL